MLTRNTCNNLPQLQLLVAFIPACRAESVSNAVKENDVERGTVASYLNRPIVFTLGAEVRKAAYTIHNFAKE